MSETTISLNPNGPFRVTGPVKLMDSAGNVFDTAGKPALFLCRCGASSNKPFCDGAHKGCGFASDEQAG